MPVEASLANLEQDRLLPRAQASTAKRGKRPLGGENRQERTSKRAHFIQDRIQRPRFPGQSLLEQEAVTPAVGHDYQKRYTEFTEFAKRQRLPLRGAKKLDEALVSFLNNAFELGYDLSEATKFFAAVLDAHPGSGHKDTLPRSRRCLKGWHRLDPGKTRPPLPWALVALIVIDMLQARALQVAALVLLMFTTYMRPGEALSVRKEDLILPNRSCKHYSLNLYPDFRPERSKMGLADENILLDSRQVPWLGDALHLLARKNDCALLEVTVTQLRNQWEATLLRIGLRGNHCVPYQLRHSGPSHDLLTRARSMLEVKMRGRWAADSSVKRYEAHARVGQEFQALPKKVQQKALAAADSFDLVAQKFFGVKTR